ncbi:GAF domain-containing protein [Glutamicibacter sp. PS]|uniref:helix-turn-helix domain-containing protein n=1 Tax=Glutamicibacter sp. PS TaxID=3075634 RepID=UPI0028410FCB|nr:GAF domain-containing protein [Glutamicibacter sp. PS]MDR4533419.1 GAF domain-containing protein [Glutamicibacter sp. PS]
MNSISRDASRPQPALGAGEDPKLKARALLPLHRSWAESRQVAQQVRPVVARSWQRAGDYRAAVNPLDSGDLNERRQAHRELQLLLPLFKERLLATASDAQNQLVIADGAGYVLWVLGPFAVRRRSDGIGFVQGARWRENDVGTNGIGAAMAEKVPVQIFGPEHAREEQHSWVCTSAPIMGPGGDRLLGTITLSGSYRTAHPHTLSLLSAVLGEARGELARAEQSRLQRLVDSTQLPDGGYVLVDEQGTVAAQRGFVLAQQLSLPAALGQAPSWVPGLGVVNARPVPGGWILAPTASETLLELYAQPHPHAVIRVEQGSSEIALSHRHWQILRLLAQHPQGVEAEQLRDLWPSPASAITVRAEISRLRSRLGGLIGSRPYRLLVPARLVD